MITAAPLRSATVSAGGSCVRAGLALFTAASAACALAPNAAALIPARTVRALAPRS
jgi:hypothetical protein